jgi:hypothetical protein
MCCLIQQSELSGAAYTVTTWVNHGKDLTGVIGKVNTMISLGIFLGCDMSEEIALSASLYVPTKPGL